MSEVLVQFDEPQRGPNGRDFVAQVCGRRMPEGLWEAWIQFTPADGGDPVSTGRATEQLSRGDLRFWAAGLTRAYLADALAESLSPQGSARYAEHGPVFATFMHPPLFSEHEPVLLETNALSRPRPVIDPFALIARGEYALRQELRALDAPRLRDIIVAYDLPEIDTTQTARTFEDALTEQIVAGVQQRVGASPPLHQPELARAEPS